MHFWSCDCTKCEIHVIGHISAIFKDRDFWFYYKTTNLQAEHFSTFWVTRCTSGHVPDDKVKPCLQKIKPISLKRFLIDMIFSYNYS